MNSGVLWQHDRLDRWPHWGLYFRPVKGELTLAPESHFLSCWELESSHREQSPGSGSGKQWWRKHFSKTICRFNSRGNQVFNLWFSSCADSICRDPDLDLTGQHGPLVSSLTSPSVLLEMSPGSWGHICQTIILDCHPSCLPSIGSLALWPPQSCYMWETRSQWWPKKSGLVYRIRVCPQSPMHTFTSVQKVLSYHPDAKWSDYRTGCENIDHKNPCNNKLCISLMVYAA